MICKIVFYMEDIFLIIKNFIMVCPFKNVLTSIKEKKHDTLVYASLSLVQNKCLLDILHVTLLQTF